MRRLALLLLLALPLQAQVSTLEEAIRLALANNPDVVIERDTVSIANATVARAEAAYEPLLKGDARLRERTDPANTVLSGAPPGELAPTMRTFQTSASVVQLLPTGATVSLFSGANRDSTNSRVALLTPSWATNLGAEVRQPLMQNRRIDPARRAIRIARADRSRALSSFRRTVSEVTAAVERAWWTLAAARREVTIRGKALSTARNQLEQTRIRIEAGTQAESDLAQATAEVERRRSEVIVAQENAQRAENALRTLIARGADDPLWTVPLGDEASLDAPRDSAPVPRDPAAAVVIALKNRPELEELAQRLQRQDIEIESAVDRVRPQVDLVASYHGRGLAGTPNENAIQPFGPVVVADDLNGGLGQSLRTIGENEFPDAAVGVSVSLPIGNTAAKQDVVIARAQRRQAQATLEATRQRISAEVRNALAAVDSAEQRIDAAAATRKAAEVQLEAESVRFEAGTTNMFFVITRQNELAAAERAEAIAIADYRKALSELARATGTLLDERGITLTETDEQPRNGGHE